MSTRMRRAGLALASALALGTVLAGCGSSAGDAGDGKSLNIVYFEGGQGSDEFFDAMKTTLWTAFTDKGGVIDRQAGDCGISRLAQQVQANNVTPSIWHFCSIGEMQQAIDDGLLQKLDTKVVPLDLLTDDTQTEYGVGWGVWHIGLMYDADTVSKPMTSIADFFDTKTFPGKRCVQNAPPQYTGILEAALLHLGTKPADLYPLDFDKAYGELDRIRSDIMLVNNAAEGSQNMLTGECGIALASAADARWLQAENPDRHIEFVQQDGIRAMAALGIPKGAPNPYGANQYLKDVIEDRSAQEGLLEATGVVPFMLKDPIEVPKSLAGWEESLTGKNWIPMAERWYQDNFDSILTRWNAWVVG
ncbi:extracellular solute-binding protein [Microbacterium gorillae]|uniref:extracellular solute-binding protein n=1 Tax=Microbacterium gorillae TaxID=1231063 RepID=UPI0018A85501|nr:extracellular solute-binding protein [Microbacterium gorillae]